MGDDVFEYDFGGYVTKYGVQCSDGRVITKEAFKECDNTIVPLVFQHCHTDIGNVLGRCLLECRDDGVYGYGDFNSTANAKDASIAVEHGDLDSLSIYANRLVQDGPNVIHGAIREVSLVLTGANPEAKIDNISFQHADGYVVDSDEDAIIYSGVCLDDYFKHADEEPDEESDDSDDGESDGRSISDIFDSMTDKQKDAVYAVIEMMRNSDDTVAHADSSNSESSDENSESSDDTIGDVFDSMTEEQRQVAYMIIAEMTKGSSDENDSVEHSGMETDMHKNVFDGTTEDTDDQVIIHAEDVHKLMLTAQARGSFKAAFSELDEAHRNAFLQHDGETYTVGVQNTYPTRAYGVSNIGLLFPEARTLDNEPGIISRPMEWVPKVLNGVRKAPFSRIRSIDADLTPDEARARGYVTGALKVEEVIGLISRETYPTTVYKKQKFNRDEVISITDFDIIRWIRSEMRTMLDEEIARCILIGDGRSALSPDKVKEDCVRPIWTDSDLYTIKVTENAGTDTETLMDDIMIALDDYRGSGSPVMFAAPGMLTQMLLLKDEFGHRMYKTKDEVASACGVSDIITVPLMKNLSRVQPPTTQGGNDGYTANLFALVVNLRDYTVGTDKGGEVNSFDDFDIDYNQMKYLIETRMSGAMTKVYSAIAIEVKAA